MECVELNNSINIPSIRIEFMLCNRSIHTVTGKTGLYISIMEAKYGKANGR